MINLNTPFIIAEISANHGGSIDIAKQSITAAKKAGASAVKMQTYTADTMTININSPEFIINEGLWEGYTLYDLYAEAQTPYEWHEDLFKHAKDEGVILFSTPFDESAVALLEDLDSPMYKIASFEMTDLNLVSAVAKTGKPTIISTGMANLEEIAETVDAFKFHSNAQLVLLHCVSAYPSPVDAYNLNCIKSMASAFGLPVGLSDHTDSNVAAMVSAALGANVFEKHFIIDKNLGGPDSSFSIEPEQLRNYIIDINTAFYSLGNGVKKTAEIEKENIKFRRSLYFVNNLEAGQQITAEDIRAIRPGHGLETKHLQSIIGKTLKKDVAYGTPVSLEHFEKN